MMDTVKDADYNPLLSEALDRELSALRSECEELMQEAYIKFKKVSNDCISLLEAKYKEKLQVGLSNAATNCNQTIPSARVHPSNGGLSSPEQNVKDRCRTPDGKEVEMTDLPKDKPARDINAKHIVDEQSGTANSNSSCGSPRFTKLEEEIPNVGLSSQCNQPVPTPVRVKAYQDEEGGLRSWKGVRGKMKSNMMAVSVLGRAAESGSGGRRRKNFQQMVDSLTVELTAEQREQFSLNVETPNERMSMRERMNSRKSLLLEKQSSKRLSVTPSAKRPDSPLAATPRDSDALFRQSNTSLDELMKELQLTPFQKLTHHIDVLMHGLVMNELTTFRKCWDAIIFMSLIYCCFNIPYRLAFIWPADLKGFWLFMVYVNDVVFNMDILLNFFTAVKNKDGIYQWDMSYIANEYVKTWFLMDVCSSVPFDRLYNGLVNPQATWPAFLRLLRLTSLIKFDKRFKSVERNLNNPFNLRLFKSGLIISVAVHWFACIAYVVAENTLYVDDWIGVEDFLEKSSGFIYIRLIYWVSVSMIGESSSPHDIPQTFTSLMMFWGGLMMYFTLCSTLVTILVNMKLPKIEFDKNRDRRLTHMQHLMLPVNLRLKILDHFDEVNSVTQGVDPQEFLAELPYHLRQEVALVMTEKSLETFRIFDHAPVTFLAAVMMRVKLSICMDGDVLCIEGDLGEEMFFVISGELNVFKKGVGKIGTLKEGTLFGEKLLLAHNGRRGATVKATKACVLYTLSKKMFKEIQVAYPEECNLFFKKL